MGETFKYDVFLSHNKADKPRVRRLAERLRKAGLRVWFDEWVIQPGDDIYLAIERGLEASRTLVLCLSPAALRSDWVGLERSTVLFRDPANAGRRFIPLLLADCKLPDTLQRYKYIDFRQETDATFEELLVGCRYQSQLASPARSSQSVAICESIRLPDTEDSYEKITTYRRYVKLQYSHVSTIDPARHLDLSNDLIPLRIIAKSAEQVLRDSMEDADTVLHRQARQEQSWEQNQFFETEPQSITGILREHRRIVILGDAGTGKTTLLYSLLYANACVLDARQGHIPFLIPLAQYVQSREESLLSFVVRALRQHKIRNAKPWILGLLAKGRGMLLLDGLDEVTTFEHRKRIANDLLALTTVDFGENNVVCVTSRIAGFRNWFPQFTLVAISELSREQALQFVRTFVDEEEQARQIAKVIESNPIDSYAGMTPLRRIVRTPLFLAVLTLVLKRSPAKKLPSRRVDVYARCIEALLWEWAEHKGLDTFLDGVGREMLLTLMCSVALSLQRSGRMLFSRSDLSQVVEQVSGQGAAYSPSTDSLVAAMITTRGIITRCAHNLYQFYHLTFQEYLCARAIRFSENGRSELLTHAKDPKWEEVVKMYAALCDDADEICLSLLEHAGVVLCAKALEEMAVPLECLRFILRFCIRRHGTTSSLGQKWDIGHLEYLQDVGLMTDEAPETIKKFDISEAKRWIARVMSNAENDSFRSAALELADQLGPSERRRVVSEWRESRENRT